MRAIAKLALFAVAVFIGIQFLRPSIPARPATAELQVPPEIHRILENSCYSCHSNQRRLAWFDEIVPGYWLVRHDILTAREHLNFSTLGAKPPAAQKATLYEAVAMIQFGAMPLSQYLRFHPDARVSPEELASLKAYLAPWSTQPAAATTPIAPTARTNLDTVALEFNGFAFDPTFEDWHLLSITDRGDNNTFRFILGNDIAIKAAQSGNISPWPDGARFAKIAWQQQAGRDGLVHPGNFFQVELMLKDAAGHKQSEGWNWGRWRDLNLKPYGQDARFVNECTGCHQPMRPNDYVYTPPISAAKATLPKSAIPDLLNNAAALPATLPWQPFKWNPITMYVDPKSRTTATLFGNAAAIAAIRANQVSAAGEVVYPQGAVIALVTWMQRDDQHWFGARIPGAPISVEFIDFSSSSQIPEYRRFVGPTLAEETTSPNLAQRAEFIESLPPAQLP